MSASFKFLCIVALVFLSGCAQVGTLTGGEKDAIAPRIKNVNPQDKSTNFSSKQITFEFDEFVKLNNAQQNVYFIPADVKPEVSLSNKTITVSWKEDLQPNTTYTLYLNGAIQDTHEGNDSLMTYVFSTGDFIDSIFYSVRTVDAWSGNPIGKVTVALYDDSLATKAKYFGQSDQSGLVQLTNLKEGKYFLKAFADDDKNLQLSPQEIRGFRAEAIKLKESKVDSIPVRMYAPLNPKIRTFKLQAPGVIAIASSALDDYQFEAVNNQWPTENLIKVSKDSAILFLPSDTVSMMKVLAKKGDKTDTLRQLITKRDRLTKLNLKATISGGIKPSDTLQFEVNDRILSVDPSKIIAIDALSKDTIEVKGADFRYNRLSLELDRKGHAKVDFIFLEGAYSTLHHKKSSAATISKELYSDRDFGSIRVKFWESKEPLILYVYAEGNLVETITMQEPGSVLVEELLPGNYRFKVVEDVNRNGQWDTGDEAHLLQPEIIYEFEGPTVRANWETEVQLSIDANEPN